MRTVTLYGRPGCHLCDDARAALLRVRTATPFDLVEIDIEGDDALHRAYLEREGLLEQRRRRNLAGEVFAVASARAKNHLEQAVGDDAELRRLLDQVQRRELDPLSAVREILEKVFKIS